MTQATLLLQEAKARTQNLSSNLPHLVDPASISYSAKIPYKLLSFREALLWRTEELSRTACDNYERQDVCAAVLLTRGVTECAAAVWYLMDLVETQVSNKKVSPDLDEKAMSLLMGHRNEPEMPQAINVLSMLDKAEKTVKGIRRGYDALSEVAHPNYPGTAGLYSEIDTINIQTRIGKDTMQSRSSAKEGLSNLIASLTMFEYAYNRATDLMPIFIQICELEFPSLKM
jgi:hypothetical protein